MSDKSYVSLERRLCMACGAPFEPGNFLLDKRLRVSRAPRSTTGWGPCPEHLRLFDQGFGALVECDPPRSGMHGKPQRMKLAQAHRTGRVAHLKPEAFWRAFGLSIEADLPLVFVEPGVIGQLQSMTVPQDAGR